MRHKHLHSSDKHLLMAVDGELPARRKSELTAHLECCWFCRERMRSMENTIAEFVRARNSELNRELDREAARAAGSKALLRARLAAASRTKASTLRLPDEIRQIAPATGMLLAVAAVIIAVIFRSTTNAGGPEPKMALTPGETRPITLAEVCRKADADVIAEVSDETRKKVFSEYGIRGNPSNFEIDYLITPDLGGAGSLRNLWPQPYSVTWNAHVKDRLEQRLHELVCAGKLDLSTAQHDIAADWIGAYKKYIGDRGPR